MECSAAISIYPYHSQEVRDLAWACFSGVLMHAGQLPRAPASLSDCRPALTPARRDWLELLDRDATPLLEHLAQARTHRIGVYFEQLWHFFLQQDPDTELIAHNLAVHDAGRTLGEFDCIYYCHQRKRHVHLELAVKFYLAAPLGSDDTLSGAARHWLGPNTRDRLDLKLDQLLERQLRLGENALAREKLDDLGVGALHREMAFKGYLFQPATGERPAPPGWNSRREFCHWLTPVALASFCESVPATRYRVLPRRQWLAPAHALGVDSLDRDELAGCVQTHFRQEARPLLVAALDNGGEETGRFFIVPADWPQRRD